MAPRWPLPRSGTAREILTPYTCILLTGLATAALRYGVAPAEATVWASVAAGEVGLRARGWTIGCGWAK